MNVKVENTEKNTVKLTIEVDSAAFEEAMEKSYKKNVKHITLPGFRKGKAPRRFVEKYYGEAVFYEDAINFVCPEAYDKAIEENKIEAVAQPEIDIEQIGGGQNLIFTAVVTVKPEVNLGEYKGVKVDKIEYAVTEEDIDKEIEMARERNAKIVTVEDRAVENGDITNIDFEGFVDDVAFEGGKGENFDLTIGSGQFIPGFEEQLIGKNIGEDVDVNVKFPEEYHAEDLAGKDAIFKVKVNGIKVKELPEADDELAKDISEFETLAELREDIKKKLTENNETRAKRETEEKILDSVIAATEIDVPQCMIDQQIDTMLNDFGYRLSSQGMSLETYAQYSGMTIESMRDQFKEGAERAVKSRLILEKIAETEAIEVTEEDINAEYAKMAEQYKMELDKIKEIMTGSEENIKADLKVNKTLELLVAEASIKKPRKKGATKKNESGTDGSGADK